MNTPAAIKSALKFSALCLALILSPFNTRADIAEVRIAEPRPQPNSGSLFSHPGLTEVAAGVKIAMHNASVKIRLKKGEGQNLAADCEATFELENLASAEASPQDFLVAFPVTGLNSKVVTIDKFAVTVDGQTPPTVFRQAISISWNQTELQDTPVASQLDKRFAPSQDKFKQAILLADETAYPNAYIWSQRTTPSAITTVRVTYSAILRPQRVQFAKPYERPLRNLEAIPYENLNLEAIDGSYYFFDYVLLSGATWDGPIGHEIIELSIDPDLLLDPARVTCSRREPVGFSIHRAKKPSAGLIYEGHCESNSIRIELRDEKPNYDLLFTIPVKAIGQYQPQNK